MGKEYMPGNAVYAVDKKNPDKKIAATVSDYPKVGIEYYAASVNAIKNPSIEPVAITKDILLNNGFVNDYRFPDRYFFPTGRTTYFVKWDNENKEFYIGMEDSGDDRRVSIPLKYLHELQNAAYYIRGREITFTKY